MGTYGSYLKLGRRAGDGPSDNAVLDSACALGAPAVRVWAGVEGSDTAGEAVRQAVVEHARKFASGAASRGLDVVLEYHALTLTDEASSAIDLHQRVGADNLHLGWQPPNHLGFEGRLGSISRVAALVRDVHVFNWTVLDGTIVRHPLGEAASEWEAYLARLGGSAQPRPLMLEFVPGDDPGVLEREACSLLSLLGRPSVTG